MQFDVYAGHYNHIDNSKTSGASFTSVIVAGGYVASEQIQLYDEDKTYMAITIDGCLETLKLLARLNLPRLSIVIYTTHPNTTKILQRVANIFNNVRLYNNVGTMQLRDLVGMKMRRSNKTYLDSHDQLVEIVMLLIDLHRKIHFNLSFSVEYAIKKGFMLDACQYAEAHLNNAAVVTNNNVIDFNSQR